MDISLTEKDLADAPPTVRTWLVNSLFPEYTEAPEAPEAPEEEKPAAKRTKKEEPKSPAITSEDLVAKARAVVESAGNDALRGVLEDLGIERVSLCPEEKYADLLAAMSVHA